MSTRRGNEGFRRRYGRWALVLGAAAGIGAAFCRSLARRGVSLLAVDRDAEGLEALAAELGDQVELRTEAWDLGDDGLEGKLRRLIEGREVGLLVYNAASSPIGPFIDQPLSTHLQAVELNCRGPLTAIGTVVPPMIERGRGGVVLMSSLSALSGAPLVTTYAATKAFNLVLAEGLWWELGRSGVDVLSCAPGPTATPGYLASAPSPGALAPGPGSPMAVAEEALASLGRRPTVFPGRAAALSALLIGRLLPRSLAVRLVGRSLWRMYGGR